MEAKLLISRLDDEYGNQRVKSSATHYWRAARDAEEALTKNRQCKYALEVPYQLKHNMYEHMIDCLKSLKEKEMQYRDDIQLSNNYLQNEFKENIDRLVK